MHNSVLTWTGETLTADHVAGRRVLEVGSYNVNGSVRPIVEALGPASYLGIDISDGPGVDKVCELAEASAALGNFGLVICTEVLEHVVDWKAAIIDLVDLVEPLGHLLITTRSVGFPYHPYPIDTWRYTLDAMAQIFGNLDLHVSVSCDDPEAAGVFVLVQKPLLWTGPWAARLLDSVTGVTPMKQP